MTIYEINTAERSYATVRARDAAEVACAWKSRGMVPVAYVIKNGERVTISAVDITTIGETAKRLANT